MRSPVHFDIGKYENITKSDATGCMDSYMLSFSSSFQSDFFRLIRLHLNVYKPIQVDLGFKIKIRYCIAYSLRKWLPYCQVVVFLKFNQWFRNYLILIFR